MVSVTSSEPRSKNPCTTDLTCTSKKQLPLWPYYGFRGSEVLLSYIDQCHSNYKLQPLVGNGINLMDHYPLLGKKECRSEYIAHENKCYVLKHLLRCEREGRKSSRGSKSQYENVTLGNGKTHTLQKQVESHRQRQGSGIAFYNSLNTASKPNAGNRGSQVRKERRNQWAGVANRKSHFPQILTF